MKQIAILLLCVTSLFSEKREMIRMFAKSPKAFVFGDKVNLRTKPSTDASIITVMPIGTELKIGEIIESADENDQFAWVQAETKDGKKGYVHETLITVHTLKLTTDQYLYLGIAKKNEPRYELRLIANNKLLAKLTLPKKYKNHLYFEKLPTKLKPPPHYIVLSDVTGDACGEPIYNTLVQIKADSIDLLIEKTGYVDGDLGLFFDYQVSRNEQSEIIITETEDYIVEDIGDKYRHKEKKTVYNLEGVKVKKLSEKSRNYIGPRK